MTQSLYESDFLLWTEDTVAKLRARDFEHLDLENLIEEVGSLGRSEKRELLSRLTILLEHLLKRLYVSMPDNYRGWETTIRNQRIGLELLFRDGPSLRTRWDDTFADAWQIALKATGKEYRQVSFPDRWPYPYDIETMIDRDFWEE